MNKLLLLIAIITYSVINVFPQDTKNVLEIKGVTKEDRTFLAGTKIEVYENNVLVKTYPSDSKGRFLFSISLNKQYEFVVKKQNYYSKKLLFNTNVPEDDLGVFSYKFIVSMIPRIEGFDASLLDKPIGKIMYVDNVGEFDYDEEYTFAMLKKLKALMKEYEKARDKEYDRVIDMADAAFKNKEYEKAIKLYDSAIDLDPYDPYPDDQIYTIDKIVQQDENNQKNYDKSIVSADNYFSNNDLINAKKYYNKALSYKKTEKYPKEQLAIINNKLNNKDTLDEDLLAKEKEYKNNLEAADKLFEIKKYNEAITKYQEALLIKPEESYPKNRVSEINILLEQLASNNKINEQKNKDYNDAIILADKNFNIKDYVSALSNYQQALNIKPKESYPKNKIAEINKILNINKSIDDKYNGFITIADKTFTEKKYELAKNYYQQALSVKETEEYPKSKIKEIDIILIQLAKQKQNNIDKSYLNVVANADILFNNKKYIQAKSEYEKALSIKNNEVYPKQRIVEIDNIEKELANKKSKYDITIARADNNFNSDKLEEAKDDYQKALAIFPKEQYPQTRINEIENQLLSLKNIEEQKKAREKAYNDAILQGDKNLSEKKYQEAKNIYSQALSLKPDEIYPKGKIAEIDKIIAEQKAMDAKYNALLATADKSFINKKYKEAKLTYNKALQIKTTEVYPKQKIAEIDKLILEKQELDEKYKKLISEADNQFDNKQFDEAILTYSKGLQIKPNQSYPKQKIAEINKLIASKNALEKRYNEIISTADQHFINKKYEDAKTTYNNALAIKPNEAYPKQKIEEIDVLLQQIVAKKVIYEKNKKQYDKLIADADVNLENKKYREAEVLYKQALNIFPKEAYPKQKVMEINNILTGIASLENKYKQAISIADKLFAEKSYKEAIVNYKKALALKSNEAYPKQKIEESNKLIAELYKIEVDYSSRIEMANDLFKNNNLEQAKRRYQEALALKPNESFPKQRIAEINKLIADNAKMLADKETLEKNYNEYIKRADDGFNEKKYQEAILGYKLASELKPDEMYPKNRLSEISSILQKLESAQNNYNTKIEQGEKLLSQNNYQGALLAYKEASRIKPVEVLPKEKIIEIQDIINKNNKAKEQYAVLISQADKLFNQKKYIDAKSIYLQAEKILTNEEYPKTQIKTIEALIASDKAAKQKIIALKKKYDSKIAEADRLFNEKDYTNAISVYMDAKSIKPDEVYPNNQITKINTIVKTNREKLEAEYNKAIADGDKLKTEKQYNKAKEQYNKALSKKPEDAIAKARITLINNLIEKDLLAQQKQTEIDNNYKKLIKQADDNFKANSYSSAIVIYKKAKNLKQNEDYPRKQISICEKKIKEQQLLASKKEEKRKLSELQQTKKTFNKENFDYKGEKRDRSFLNELAKKYPEGITIENYDKKNKKIKRVIVNRGGIAKEYIEVKYSYGTYYFRNGQNISRSIFYSETK